MIVVSTNGDPVANILDGYALALTQWASANGMSGTAIMHLAPPHSVAQRVQQELQSHSGRSFFFFGHGTNAPPGFKAHDGNPAVDHATVNLLTGRMVSATCCYGDQMGMLATHNSFSLLGYTGLLWVPRHAHHIPAMAGPALEGPKAIMQGLSPSQSLPLARRAYAALAQTMQRRNLPGDRTFALFASMNSSSIAAW
jgi:hypothetical protein